MVRRMRIPRSKAGNISITEGPILKNVVLFASPLLLMNMVYQFYSVLDLIIVSNYCGTDAIAAIGATSFISQMIVGLALGVSTGCSVITAQAWGSGDYNRLYKAVHSGYMTALAFGTLLSILGILLSRSLLTLIGTPMDVLGGATNYLRIHMISILPVLVYNMGAGILRGVGDTRHPFLIMTITVIINLALDMLFVGVFKWGTIGAACAYVVAQFMSAILVTLSLTRVHEPYHLFLRDIAFHKDILRPNIKLGLPAGLQTWVMMSANVFVQGNINTFGKHAIAGFAAASRITGFLYVIIQGSSLIALSFMGANIGAQKKKRAKKGLVRITLFVSSIIAGLSVLFLLLRYPLLRLFTTDSEVMHYANIKLFYMLVPYTIYALVEILGGAVRGSGQSILPMVITMGMAAVRVLWILLMLPIFQSFNIPIAGYAVSWTSALIAYLVYFWRRGDRIYELQM